MNARTQEPREGPPGSVRLSRGTPEYLLHHQVDLRRRLLLHPGQHVAVDVQRDRRLRVAQALRHDVDGYSVAKQIRSVCVAKVMKTDGESVSLGELVKLGRELVGRPRGTVRATDDQTGISGVTCSSVGLLTSRELVYEGPAA